MNKSIWNWIIDVCLFCDFHNKMYRVKDGIKFSNFRNLLSACLSLRWYLTLGADTFLWLRPRLIPLRERGSCYMRRVGVTSGFGLPTCFNSNLSLIHCKPHMCHPCPHPCRSPCVRRGHVQTYQLGTSPVWIVLSAIMQVACIARVPSGRFASNV